MSPAAILAITTAWTLWPLPSGLLDTPRDDGVVIEDRNGLPLRATRAADGSRARWVAYDEIDPDLINAFVAVEDRRFWDHPGVDALALGRAAWRDLRARRVVSGASTITMQLARLLRPGTVRSWGGKVAQAMWAGELLFHHLAMEEVLAAHPGIQIAGKFASRADEKSGAEAFSLERLRSFSPDVVVLATEHELSMHWVPQLLDQGYRVVDMSGACRLKDPKLYQEWYGFEHTAATLLDEAVYGLPEFLSESIRNARLVANPGCYATAAVLPLIGFDARFGPLQLDRDSVATLHLLAKLQGLFELIAGIKVENRRLRGDFPTRRGCCRRPTMPFPRGGRGCSACFPGRRRCTG